jgi:hypothetical protein
MSQQTVFTCDGCGVQKKDANHWFRMGTFGGCQLALNYWQEGSVVDDEKHYCGAACVLKAVSEFLGSK